MTTVDDFAQGMLREYRTFARQCVALVAEVGDEERAADCFAMEDLPGVAERLGTLRARAEAAEQRAEAAEADLSALAATVGAAVVASALAPGESLSAPPQHIIVSQVNRLRARAEAAEAEAERLRTVITKAVDDLPEWSDGALKHLSPAEAMADEVRMALRAAVTR